MGLGAMGASGIPFCVRAGMTGLEPSLTASQSLSRTCRISSCIGRCWHLELVYNEVILRVLYATMLPQYLEITGVPCVPVTGIRAR